MKIYVAAKWEEKARAREVMYELVQAGHTITHDWTSVEEGPEKGIHAYSDIEGVINADVLVGIFEKDLKYTGALVELGAALGQGMDVYIIGNAPITDSLMFKHPNVRRDYWQLLDWNKDE